MGTSNAESSNTGPFRPGRGADWLFDEGKVDPTTGQFTDGSFYPAGFSELNSDGTMTMDDTLVSNDSGHAPYPVYTSGTPGATSAGVSTIAQENSETNEPEPWNDQIGTSGLRTFNPEAAADDEVSTIAHTNEGPVSEGEVPVYSTSRLRPWTACIECARLKQRCDGQSPCGRCVDQRKTCQRRSAPPQQVQQVQQVRHQSGPRPLAARKR